MKTLESKNIDNATAFSNPLNIDLIKNTRKFSKKRCFNMKSQKIKEMNNLLKNCK